MSGDMVVANVDTGELDVDTTARLTPDQAHEWAVWVRAVMRGALTEGVDYGTIPGTAKPTLFKSGAELLLRAARLGFTNRPVEDEDRRTHRGITYRCSVHTAAGIAIAECDGYAGYDERNYRAGPDAVPWNTLVKMAAKRALVGAALNATAASGLFSADLDDDSERIAARRAPNGATIPADRVPAPADPATLAELATDIAHLDDEHPTALDDVRGVWQRWAGPNLNWGPGRVSAIEAFALRTLIDAAVETLDAVPDDVYDDAPEAAQADDMRFDPGDAGPGIEGNTDPEAGSE